MSLSSLRKVLQWARVNTTVCTNAALSQSKLRPSKCGLAIPLQQEFLPSPLSLEHQKEVEISKVKIQMVRGFRSPPLTQDDFAKRSRHSTVQH